MRAKHKNAKQQIKDFEMDRNCKRLSPGSEQAPKPSFLVELVHCCVVLGTTFLIAWFHRTATTYNILMVLHSPSCGPGSSVGIATGYGLDGPGIESRWGARFSPPVQTGPGAHTASCTMDTGSFPGVKSGRGVTLTPVLF